MNANPLLLFDPFDHVAASRSGSFAIMRAMMSMTLPVSLCGPRGPRLPGIKPAKAVSLEVGLRLVEGRARYAETRRRIGDGMRFRSDAPEHLVLHLDQISRVEELAVDERWVAHVLRTRIGGALRTQRFEFESVGLRGGIWGEKLGRCVSIIMPYLGTRQGLLRRGARLPDGDHAAVLFIPSSTVKLYHFGLADLTAKFPFHIRHHFLDARRFARRGGRWTSRWRAITFASSIRSLTWNNARPAEIATNTFGAAALVHEAGIRFSWPRSW